MFQQNYAHANSGGEICRHPPLFSWVKCNTYGATLGCHGLINCGVIFNDYTIATRGCFAVNIGNTYALHAELLRVMFAIKIAYKKCWCNLWLETDSQLVNLAFKSRVVWFLGNDLFGFSYL